MTENQRINKQMRHESAKQKYRSYQHNISSQIINSQANTYLPNPGQYAIRKNSLKIKNSSVMMPTTLPLKPDQKFPKIKQSESQLILTKNIEQIIRGRDMSSMDEIVHQLSNKRLLKRQDLSLFSESKKKLRIQNMHEKTDPSEQVKGQYLKRPISVKLYKDISNHDLDESQVIASLVKKGQNEKGEQKKSGTHFSRKLNIPKHIYGYKTVNLFETKKTEHPPSNNPTFQANFHPHLQSSNLQRQFLPIEYYLREHEGFIKNNLYDPSFKQESLLEKFRNPIDGIVRGFSRWQYTDGRSAWRKCIVEGYDKEQERWMISWVKNEPDSLNKENNQTMKKKVSRNNLCFEGENFAKFSKMVEEADNFRKSSEGFLKYNTLIDQMKTPTSGLKTCSIQRISKLIQKLTRQQHSKEDLNTLFQKVNSMFVRAQHQFQFNISLPYNRQYKQVFKGILPDSMFDRNPRKFCNLSPNPQQPKLSSKKTIQTFRRGLRKLQQISHLTSKKKIQILEIINQMREGFINPKHQSFLSIFQDYSFNQIADQGEKAHRQAYQIESLESVISRNIQNYIFTLNHKICDIEYVLSKELDPIYQNRKLIPKQQYGSIINQYVQFCKVVNHRIEDAVREKCVLFIQEIMTALNFEEPQSDHNLSKQEKILRLLALPYTQQQSKISILFKLRLVNTCLKIQPAAAQVKDSIFKKMVYLITQLTNVKCVCKSYLPEIRPKNVLNLNICDSQQQLTQLLSKKSIQNPNHNPIIQSCNQLHQFLDSLFSKLDEYLQVFSAKIQQSNQLHLETIKKSGKKFIYNEISELINRVIETKQRINVLMKGNKTRIGSLPLLLQMRQLRQIMPSKLHNLLLDISKSIILEKIFRDNDKLQKIIDKYIQTLRKVPETIEQFVNLQHFLNVTLVEEINKIKHKCRMIDERTSLIDKIGIKDALPKSDFDNCYRLYFKIVQLIEIRTIILQKLDENYRKKFIDKIIKDRTNITDQINQSQKTLEGCLKHQTISQMDKKFDVYLQLNTCLLNLEQQCKKLITHEKMLKINEGLSEHSHDYNQKSAEEIVYLQFANLYSIKEEFQLPYTFINLYKNFKLTILPVLEGSIGNASSDGEGKGGLQENIKSSISKLQGLKEIKLLGYKMCEVETKTLGEKWELLVEEIDNILAEYENFAKYLNIIGVFKNKNLRERHWNRIQQIIRMTENQSDHYDSKNNEIDIRAIEQLKNKNLGEIIKSIFCGNTDSIRFQSQLLKISEIALRELQYEKKFLALKKQWKEARILVTKNTENLNQKNIENFKDLVNKLQQNCIEIRSILESPFITFLQPDIIQWKQNNINKVKQFLDEWPRFVMKVQQCLKIEESGVYRLLCYSDIELESQKKQDKKLTVLIEILKRNYSNLLNSIEFQVILIDIVNNPKTDDYITCIKSIISSIWLVVSSAISKIKRKNSKFIKFFNNQDILSMNISSGVFKGYQKCWNISQIRIKQDEQTNEKQMQLINHFKEKIKIKVKLSQSGSVFYHLDELTAKLQQELRKQLKKQLNEQILQDNQSYLNKERLLQIKTTACRLQFTQKIEQALSINRDEETLAKYQQQIQKKKSQYINELFKTKQTGLADLQLSQLEIFSLIILELINQSCVLSELIEKNVCEVSDFDWQKIIRYYPSSEVHLNDEKLRVDIINNAHLYEYDFADRIFFEPYHSTIYEKTIVSLVLPLIQGKMIIGRSENQDYIKQKYQWASSMFGKSINIINANTITNFKSQLSEIMRLGVSGAFTILTHLQSTSLECLHLLDESVKSYHLKIRIQQASRINENRSLVEKTNKCIAIMNDNGESINVFPNNLWFAGIIDFQSERSNIDVEKYKSMFRNIALCRIPESEMLKLKFECYGFDQQFINDLGCIDLILNELQCRHSYELIHADTSGIEISRINRKNFITQLEYRILEKSLIDKKSDSVDILRLTIAQLIEQCFKMTNKASQQHSNLYTQFWINMSKLRVPILKKPNNNKLHKITIEEEKGENQFQIDQQVIEISQILENKKGIFICGPSSSAVTLLNRLQILMPERYIIRSVNSRAYFKEELYADKQHSLLRALVMDLYQILTQTDNRKDQLTGIIQIRISQSVQELRYLKNIIMNLTQHSDKIKIIIESESLKRFSLEDLEQMYVLFSDKKVAWKSLYQQIFQEKFIGMIRSTISDSLSVSKIERTFEEIIEPFIQFYLSIASNSNHLRSPRQGQKSQISEQRKPNFIKHPCIIQEPISLIKHIIELSRQLYNQWLSQHAHQKTVNYSPIMNILFFASLTIIGHTLPEQLKKLLSKHFRYILQQIDNDLYINKTVIQGELQGWNINQIYNNRKKQQNIFDYFYYPQKNYWFQCSCLVDLQNSHPNRIEFHHYTLLKYNMRRYFKNSISAFLVGEPHTSKSQVFMDLFKINTISLEESKRLSKNLKPIFRSRKAISDGFIGSNLDNQNIYEVETFHTTKFTNKSRIVAQILKSLRDHRYSQLIQGIANHKTNVYFIDDFYLGSQANQHGSIQEFLAEFLIQQGFYIPQYNNIHKLKKIKNLQFYGTISLNNEIERNNQNSRQKAAAMISDRSIFILMPEPDNRLESILKFKLTLIGLPEKHVSRLLKCTLNFYDSLIRDCPMLTTQQSKQKIQNQGNQIKSQLWKNLLIKFNRNDLVKAMQLTGQIITNFEYAETLTKTGNNLDRDGEILKIWAYSIEKIFSQKIMNVNSHESLFYFLNNTLMEEERLRYKQIIIKDSCHLVRISQNRDYYTTETIKTFISKLLDKHLANINEKLFNNKYILIYKHDTHRGKQICEKFVEGMLKVWSILDMNINKSKVIFIFNQQLVPINSILKAVSLSIGMNIFYPQGQQKESDSKVPNLNHLTSNLNINQAIMKLQDKYKLCYSCESQLNKMITCDEVINSNVAHQPNIFVMPDEAPYIATDDTNKHAHPICRNHIFETILGFQKMNILPEWVKQSLQERDNRNFDNYEGNKHWREDSQSLQNQFYPFYFIFTYKRISEFFVKNYKNLLDESSVIYYQSDINKDLATVQQSIRTYQNKSEFLMTGLKEEQTTQVLNNCKLSSSSLIKPKLWIEAMKKYDNHNETLVNPILIHSVQSVFENIYLNYSYLIEKDNKLHSITYDFIDHELDHTRQKLALLIDLIKNNITHGDDKLKNLGLQIYQLEPLFIQEQKKYNRIKTEIQMTEDKLQTLSLEYGQSLKEVNYILVNRIKSIVSLISNKYNEIKNSGLMLDNNDPYCKIVMEVLNLILRLTESEAKTNSIKKGRQQPIKQKKDQKSKMVVIKSLAQSKILKRLSKLSLETLNPKTIKGIVKLIRQTKEECGCDLMDLTNRKLTGEKYWDQFIQSGINLVQALVNGWNKKEELCDMEADIQGNKKLLEKQQKQRKNIENLKKKGADKKQQETKGEVSTKKTIRHEEQQHNIAKISNYKSIFKIFERYEGICRQRDQVEHSVGQMQKLLEGVQNFHTKVEQITANMIPKIRSITDNQEKIKNSMINQVLEEYPLKMVTVLYSFNNLVAAPTPISNIHSFVHSILGSTPSKSVKTLQSSADQFQELTAIIKNSLYHYKGCILFQTNYRKIKEEEKDLFGHRQLQEESSEHPTAADHESFQMHVLKNIILNKKYDEIQYEDFIGKINKIEEVLEVDLNLQLLKEMEQLKHLSQQYSDRAADKDFWKQYYQSNDKDNYWKKKKNMHIQNDLFKTLIQLADKGSITENISQEFNIKSNLRPLIINVENSSKKHLTIEKVEKLFRILEIYGNSYLLGIRPHEKWLSNYQLLQLRNRSIIICAQNFNEQMKCLFPYWQIDPTNSEASSRSLNWKNYMKNRFQYQSMCNATQNIILSKFTNHISLEIKNKREVTDEFEEKKVLQVAAKLSGNFKQLIEWLTKMIKHMEDKQQQNQHISYLQTIDDEVKFREALRVVIDSLPTLDVVIIKSSSQQCQDVKGSNETIKFSQDSKAKVQKICLTSCKFYKLIELFSRSIGCEIDFFTYCHDTIEPIFQSYFTNFSQLKSPKQSEQFFTRQISKLDKKILEILYQKYCNILLSKQSPDVEMNLMMGVAALNESQHILDKELSCSESSINLFAHILKASINRLQSPEKHIQTEQLIKEVETVYTYYQSGCNKNEIPVDNGQLKQIVHKNLKKYLLTNQYPYKNIEDQSQPKLLGNIPKIILGYLMTILEPEMVSKHIQNNIDHLFLSAQIKGMGEMKMGWQTNCGYGNLKNEIHLLSADQMNQQEFELLLKNIQTLSHPQKCELLPTNLHPTNLFRHKKLQNSIRESKKSLKNSVPHLSMKIKQNDHKTTKEQKQLENLIRNSLINAHCLIVAFPNRRDIDYLITKFHLITEQVVNETKSNNTDKNKEVKDQEFSKLFFVLGHSECQTVKKYVNKYPVASRRHYNKRSYQFRTDYFTSGILKSQIIDAATKTNKNSSKQMALMNTQKKLQLQNLLNSFSEIILKYTQVLHNQQNKGQNILAIKFIEIMKNLVLEYSSKFTDIPPGKERNNRRGSQIKSSHKINRQMKDVDRCWVNDVRCYLLSLQGTNQETLGLQYVSQLINKVMKMKIMASPDISQELPKQNIDHILKHLRLNHRNKEILSAVQSRIDELNHKNLYRLLGRSMSNRIIDKMKMVQSQKLQNLASKMPLHHIVYLSNKIASIFNLIPYNSIHCELILQYNCVLYAKKSGQFMETKSILQFLQSRNSEFNEGYQLYRPITFINAQSILEPEQFGELKLPKDQEYQIMVYPILIVKNGTFEQKNQQKSNQTIFSIKARLGIDTDHELMIERNLSQILASKHLKSRFLSTNKFWLGELTGNTSATLS